MGTRKGFLSTKKKGLPEPGRAVGLGRGISRAAFLSSPRGGLSFCPLAPEGIAGFRVWGALKTPAPSLSFHEDASHRGLA